ncbi:unnamed protein product [Cyprideis torosa]|uniref:Transmembrane protein 208 n=1 Tax=Cyprideis torosa TaxID=163714 RepID=A0A7R8W954_9CRUS|nr:unnamed protein product [Cyprideis torosa]CAG0884503.1 unnamed protein product [Cyprideis torosa]
MPAKPGKAATKGQKQIFEENNATVAFYRNMALGTSVFWVVLNLLLASEVSLSFILLSVLSVGVLFGSIAFMKSMARATFDAKGNVLDGGIDLNMEAGIAEHIKDIIILTASCQVLGCLSDYFWFLWLVIPGRALFLLWRNVLGPWFFAPAAENGEDPDAVSKKQRKLERKMKRFQQ